MTKDKTISLFMCAALLALSACNLPIAPEVAGTASTVQRIRVSTATEYRTGPGEVYDLIGVLNPGQEVEAIGRSPDGDYLLIRDPANPAVLCWLKSEFSTISGDLASLPISAPPPTPTSIGVPTVVVATTVAGGCPTPVGGGPTPVSCATPVPAEVGGCPTPVGGGPTPVSCATPVPTEVGGCPTPVGGGPTPVSCATPVPAEVGGCPTPVGGGPTPVSCATPVPGPVVVGGCPTPVGGGPTPVSCSGSSGGPAVIGGCPTPVGGGPTPVSCSPLDEGPY